MENGWAGSACGAGAGVLCIPARPLRPPMQHHHCSPRQPSSLACNHIRTLLPSHCPSTPGQADQQVKWHPLLEVASASLLPSLPAPPPQVKLISEPWDIGAYMVGSWPNWDVWAEWNGKYRDDVRRFLRCAAFMAVMYARMTLRFGDDVRRFLRCAESRPGNHSSSGWLSCTGW